MPFYRIYLISIILHLKINRIVFLKPILRRENKETMSAKSTIEDLPVFSECENETVEFESTWCLERVYDKAIPIPTQTDPVNKTEDKSTSSQDLKHIATQTEPFSIKTATTVDEKKLVESLRKLSVLMESEVKLGTTSVFKF